MKRRFPKLEKIDFDRPITTESDGLFLQKLEHGLLLALLEKGYITDTQLHLAEKRLRN